MREPKEPMRIPITNKVPIIAGMNIFMLIKERS